MRAAIGQICSTANMAHNLEQCKLVIAKAVEREAKALFLPEASDYIGSSPAESLSLCKPATQSVFVRGLQSEARRHGLPINVGIHEPSDKNPNKMRNTLIWIDERGEIAQRYEKLHLFDVDLSSEGGPKMRESETTEPGKAILPPFQTAVGRVGLAMCFDLRFAEQALVLRRQGAEIITYPSAFATRTGEMHWHALLRARAIETESYVVAAAQVGAHSEKRSSYGHGMIVSPWGEIVAELGGCQEKDVQGDAWEPEVAVADIDLKIVEKMRKEMVLDRRTDVYGEL